MYRREELTGLGFGPSAVTVITSHQIQLMDGINIACKIWFPSKKDLLLQDFSATAKFELYCDGETENAKQYPSILEYLPYRHGDYTAPRDHQRHPWMASHGFVIVRADMRGSGDSTGLMHDEYEQQEQNDACHIIEWISGQNWSNGNVGMYGKSWGGFNGLQVAFCQSKALKAVISLYSTDNRFSDDIHWKGGCVLGNGMLGWASTMFAWKAQPPNPSMNEAWKEEWRRRLEKAGESWVKKWLQHQSYDSYWRHGSICEDYSRVNIPVLAIGGWQDSYTNAVFRLIKELPNCRAIIGPWGHEWPDIAQPGPQIGFTSECLDFWEHHLKGKLPSQKQIDAKKLIWYQCEGLIPPGPFVQHWPGKWLQSDRPYPSAAKRYHLRTDQTISEEEEDDYASFRLEFSTDSGLFCGEWLSFGGPDLPPDQRMAGSTTWMSAEVTEEIKLLGFPEFECRFLLENDSQGQMAVRLCDVFPDGQMRFICHGVQNLNRHGNGSIRILEQDKRYPAKVTLDAVGYSLQPGHRFSVSVSASYWPTAWTPRVATVVSISDLTVTLPLVEGSVTERAFLHQEPLLGPALPEIALRKSSLERSLRFDLSSEEKERIMVVVSDGGRRHWPSLGVTLDTLERVTYKIGCSPLSAEAVAEQATELVFPMDKKMRVETWSKMDADGNSFHLENRLKTILNGEVFFEKTWKDVVERQLV